MVSVKMWYRYPWVEVTGNTYPLRQELKARKYEWDADSKTWLKEVYTSEEIRAEVEFLRQIAEVEIHDSIRIAIEIIDICPFSFFVYGKNTYGKNNVEIHIENEKDVEKAIEIAKKIHSMLKLENKGEVSVHLDTKCVFCTSEEI